jgi:hypothetical protein
LYSNLTKTAGGDTLWRVSSNLLPKAEDVFTRRSEGRPYLT